MKAFKWLWLVIAAAGTAWAQSTGGNGGSQLDVESHWGHHPFHTFAVLSFVLLVVFITSYFRTVRHRERLALLRTMVEKGQPVSAELLDSRWGSSHGTRPRGAHRALVPIFVGAALCFCLWFTDNGSWVWGLIPVSVGLAILLSSAMERQRPQ